MRGDNRKKSAELREMGRFPYPMIRRRGDRGFRRIIWEEALQIIGDRIKATNPERLGLKDGDGVVLKNELVEFAGRVCTALIKPGN